MKRKRNSLGPLICYHGCHRQVAEDVLANKCAPSRNPWDWLGYGTCFWVDSWTRGIDWALEGKDIEDPYVVGAYVHPGLCLNLTDFGVSDEIKKAHALLKSLLSDAGSGMPTNKGFVRRDLDCGVLEFAHGIRKDRGLDAYETVLGAFEEGDAAFPGSLLKEKTHMQLVVREGHEHCILGYFHVPGIENEIEAMKQSRTHRKSTGP
jgi:hypothetical protein